jgi:hypothetical protein
MEQLSFQQLSTPRGEFLEPPPSTQIILTSSYELLPDLITLVWELFFSRLESENHTTICWISSHRSHDTRYPHVEVVPLLSYREGQTMVHVYRRQHERQLG